MSNKQRTVPLIPPTVEDAETAIRNLTAKRDALVARGTELATNRASVAYKALSEDDAVAKRKLEEINKESVSHSHELASVDAALVTARSRLETAKLFEARAAQAEHAQAIRDEWAQVEKDLADLDAGFSFAVGAAKRFYERCERMKLHGLKVPPQQTLMMADVVVSALMAMPPPLWRELNHLGLEHLAPNRRRSAASLATAWGPQVQRQAAAIGGEQQEQATNNKPAAA